MSPSEIYELFEENPESAFRLRLSSGDEVIVANPRRTLIENLVLHVGLADDPDAPIATSRKYVSIPNIALIERMDRNQLRPRIRRGRR